MCDSVRANDNNVITVKVSHTTNDSYLIWGMTIWGADMSRLNSPNMPVNSAATLELRKWLGGAIWFL